MMHAELVLAIAALAVLLTSGAWVVASYRGSRTFWAAIGAAALVFVVRWALAEPTFVHASLHGPRLLEHPYNNPYEAFRGYGPLAPLLHGWLLRWLGADLTPIAFFHQLCSSFALVPLAWLAGRLAGSRVAMIGAFVVAALYPVFVRIGASEDAHALAVLMMWIGLASMHDYAQTDRKSRLLLAAAALILMMYTRQIMLAVLPFPFLLAVVQRRALLRDRWFLAAVAVCVALLALRLAVLAANPDQAFHMRSLAVRFPSGSIVLATLRHHPLFDVGLYQPLFVPLWVIGTVAVWRSSPLGRAFVLFFVAFFFATLWPYEGRNVALMFRMPLLTVACVLAGVGFARCAARTSKWVAAGAGGLILCVPLLMPGWRIVTEIRPLTAEYRVIQASTDALPERFILVVNAGGGIDRPGYQFPTHVLRDANIDVVEHTPQDVVQRDKLDEPLLFFRGVGCYAYSMIELSNVPALDFATIIRSIGEAAANHRVPDDVVVPREMRPECVVLLEGAELIGELTRVPARPDDVPFELYGVDELEMGFYRLTPEAVRRAAELSPAPER
jgi:hypothetical protein